jgi:hypothetical protein
MDSGLRLACGVAGSFCPALTSTNDQRLQRPPLTPAEEKREDP